MYSPLSKCAKSVCTSQKKCISALSAAMEDVCFSKAMKISAFSPKVSGLKPAVGVTLTRKAV